MKPTQAQLGIHPDIGGGFSVLTAGPGLEPEDLPESPADFQSWAAAGWRIAWPVHGNGDRGAQVTIQKGTSVAKPQAILAVEKDGKRFRAVARWVYGAEEPEKWKDLDAWAEAGWVVQDTTGNLEHGAFWTLAPADSGAAS